MEKAHGKGNSGEIVSDLDFGAMKMMKDDTSTAPRYICIGPWGSYC